MGPLDQRGGFWWDGYDSVSERVSAALADRDVQAVVLAIDSPGGVVAGCFDAARGLVLEHVEYPDDDLAGQARRARRVRG